MSSNVVIFDKPYSDEKIAEGRAVQWAVVSRACNRCNHLQQCESNNNFEFPQNAPCMIKKAEFMKGGEQK